MEKVLINGTSYNIKPMGLQLIGEEGIKLGIIGDKDKTIFELLETNARVEPLVHQSAEGETLGVYTGYENVDRATLIKSGHITTTYDAEGTESVTTEDLIILELKKPDLKVQVENLTLTVETLRAELAAAMNKLNN